MHLLCCGACAPALSGANAPRSARHLPAQWFLDAIVVEMDSVDGAELGNTAGRAQTVAGSLAALRLLAEPQAHALPRSWACCTNVVATICRAAEQIADLLQRAAERPSGLLVAIARAPQNGGILAPAAWWDRALAQCFECLRSWLLAANSKAAVDANTYANANGNAAANTDANVVARGPHDEGEGRPRSTASLLQDESITRSILSAVRRGRSVESSEASHAAALLVDQMVRQWGSYGSAAARDAPRRSRAFSHLLAPGRIVSIAPPLRSRSAGGVAFRLAVRDGAGSTQWEISPVVGVESSEAVGGDSAAASPNSADAGADEESDAGAAAAAGARADGAGEVDAKNEHETEHEGVDRVRDLIRFIESELDLEHSRASEGGGRSRIDSSSSGSELGATIYDMPKRASAEGSVNALSMLISSHQSGDAAGRAFDGAEAMLERVKTHESAADDFVQQRAGERFARRAEDAVAAAEGAGSGSGSASAPPRADAAARLWMGAMAMCPPLRSAAPVDSGAASVEYALAPANAAAHRHLKRVDALTPTARAGITMIYAGVGGVQLAPVRALSASSTTTSPAAGAAAATGAGESARFRRLVEHTASPVDLRRHAARGGFIGGLSVVAALLQRSNDEGGERGDVPAPPSSAAARCLLHWRSQTEAVVLHVLPRLVGTVAALLPATPADPRPARVRQMRGAAPSAVERARAVCARVTREDKVCVVWSEDRARDAFAGGADAARHALRASGAEEPVAATVAAEAERGGAAQLVIVLEPQVESSGAGAAGGDFVRVSVSCESDVGVEAASHLPCVGPLLDGMIVSDALLPALLRQTALHYCQGRSDSALSTQRRRVGAIRDAGAAAKAATKRSPSAAASNFIATAYRVSAFESKR